MFTLNELKDLRRKADPVSVSVFMPLHRSGKESEQDPIRLKNLLRQTEQQLLERLRRPQIEALLQPARTLLEDSSFWVYHSADGLAMFLTPNFFRYYRVPHRFDERCDVGKRFNVKPLLPLLLQDGQFYILALSTRTVRLFQATRETLVPIELPDQIKPVEQILREAGTVLHEGLQPHPGAPAGQQAGPAVHGHAPADVQKRLEEEHFRRLVKQIDELLKAERIPLVVAAVDRWRALFEQSSRYEPLLEAGVKGSPDELDEKQMHERAWRVAAPWFEQGLAQSLERFGRLAGSERTSTSVEQILPAAHHGRIEILFARSDSAVWGRYDPDTADVTVHDRPQAGDEELTTLCVEAAILHDGTAYALPTDRLPAEQRDRPLGAVFRW